MTGIFVGLDVSDLDRAENLSRQLSPHVGGFKVGLQLLTGYGPTAIERIAKAGKPVFVDAKLHDIPNTVGRAMANLREAGARWVTVHTTGGREMLETAVANIQPAGGVLGVTMLTSLDDERVAEVGFSDDVRTQVKRLAGLASSVGAEGIVCSAHETAAVKGVDPGLIVVTPGIRLAGESANDQSRVMTPERAAGLGADYLVIGRSIVGADDPVAAAESIAKSLVPTG